MNRIKDAETIEPSTRLSDGDLLRRFLADRNDAAFTEIVARHGTMVFGVAMRRLGRCQDAEDAFQAVFLALARRADKLVDGVTVGPWLYTIARQVCTKALRSQRRRRWVFWRSAAEPTMKPPTEVNVDLDSALASLSEQERSAVILCHLEGLSRAEAAKALGCPEGTLSARLSRALEKLRRKLGKPPLAIFAAAMLVMVPETLSASTLGLVRHFRDGTLDDWASPRTLELYRKAVPMRLIDRIGPALTAVVAAVLVLLGATFGWQMIVAQQPPKDDQLVAKGVVEPPAKASGTKVTFAAAIEEMQKTKPQQVAEKTSFEFGIDPPLQGFKPQPANFPWYIHASEILDGIRVEHTCQNWPVIEPFLKEIVYGGVKRITVRLNLDVVGRLEANQIINTCKRAGFDFVDYQGPELFFGTKSESWKARGRDVKKVSFEIELEKATGNLPDWTNGWFVSGETIEYRPNVEVTTAVARDSLDAVASTRGPAFEIALKESGPARGLNVELPEISDLAKGIKLQSQAENATGALVDLSGIDKTYMLMKWMKNQGEVISTCSEPRAFSKAIRRAAKTSRRRMEVTTYDAAQKAQPELPIINPFDVNMALNACKQAGVKEVNYVGQKLFTGSEPEFGVPRFTSNTNGIGVTTLTLEVDSLDGLLPEERDGWSLVWANVIGQPTARRIVKTSEAERFQEKLKRLNEDMFSDSEVARLAKLPLAEFERELARKPSILRNRWRKSVEEARAKKQ